MSTTKTTRITLRYDGEIFDGHSMDAIQIADAIKGLATSLIQADKLINGEESTLGVEVVAFQDGCFGTVLDILQSDVSVNDVLTTMGFLTGVLAGKDVAQGMLGYVKRMSGRKIADTVRTGGTTKLTFTDNSTMEMPSNVAMLITDKTVRRGLDSVLHKPLMLDGADSVTIGLTVDGKNAAEMKEQVVVTNEEHISFKAPVQTVQTKKDESEETFDVYFTRINFRERKSWAVLFPDNSEHVVKMNDDAFFDRANKNKQEFSSEKLFSVKFDVTTTTTADTVKKTYAVNRVLRHRADRENKLIPDAE